MTLVPSTKFAHLASDKDITTVVIALTAKVECPPKPERTNHETDNHHTGLR
jgi:hypothetical protein